MILAEFFKRNSEYIGFQISGHAGYDVVGMDIACASVSSAVQLTANTITDFMKIKADVDVVPDKIKLNINEDCSRMGSIIIESLKFHLELISQQFKETIRIKATEV